MPIDIPFIPSILSILQTTPQRWLHLVESVPEPLFARSPVSGQWSALACLQHIIDTEHVLQLRLRAFLEGWESFPGFNPDAEGTQLGAPPSAQSLAGEFAALRAASLQAIGQIQPSDLGRRCLHQELGMVSLEEMLNEWPAHDLNHTIQAECALMQPFIHGCGLWQRYFTDHLARPA
jgi:hypothetical protein